MWIHAFKSIKLQKKCPTFFRSFRRKAERNENGNLNSTISSKRTLNLSKCVIIEANYHHKLVLENPIPFLSYWNFIRIFEQTKNRLVTYPKYRLLLLERIKEIEKLNWNDIFEVVNMVRLKFNSFSEVERFNGLRNALLNIPTIWNKPLILRSKILQCPDEN